MVLGGRAHGHGRSTPITTVLSASVPHPVNTTSPGRTPSRSATRSRASSIARRASRAKRCEPLGLAKRSREERQHRLDRHRPHRRRRRVVEVGQHRRHATQRCADGARCTVASRMQGYDERTYGDAFADVYDDWYHGMSDVDSSISRALLELAGAGPVLELGVGTGRLAVPLAEAGRDTRPRRWSASTPARRCWRDWRGATPAGSSTAIHGDMSTTLPDGPFALVFAAYNTLFNLVDDGAQARCFASVADRLAAGRTVRDRGLRARRAADGAATPCRCGRSRPIVSCCRSRSTTPTDQSAEGQFVELTEAGGVRLRPWSIRYATPGPARRLRRRRRAGAGAPLGVVRTAPTSTPIHRATCRSTGAAD